MSVYKGDTLIAGNAVSKNFIYCELASGQSTSGSSEVRVNLAKVIINNGSKFSLSSYRVYYNGDKPYVRVSINVRWNSPGSVAPLYFIVRKNGTEVRNCWFVLAKVSGDIVWSHGFTSTVIPISKGDYIEVAFQGSGYSFGGTLAEAKTLVEEMD